MSILRARPLLGTRVDIRVDALAEAEAHAAIDAAFAAVADIHRLMSFHEADSDVSRLNRGASAGPVGVDPRTYAVLAFAQEIAAASEGAFDICVGARLVAWGFLPAPPGLNKEAPAPDPAATWRDIVLEGPNLVRFARPLWIDLGGIAKGYAVDMGLKAMALPADVQCVINAGGDLRVAGPHAERIALRVPRLAEILAKEGIPAIEIADGSLASSSGREHAREHQGATVGPHVDGVSGGSASTNRFVSVTAADCMTADALTKVVMAAGVGSAPALRRYGAAAYMYEADGGWVMLGTEDR